MTPEEVIEALREHKDAIHKHMLYGERSKCGITNLLNHINYAKKIINCDDVSWAEYISHRGGNS
jgi:hypothetical protein